MNSKIIRIDPNNIEDEKIEQAANLVKEGKIVIFPTDTVYGLGTDPFNIRSVRRILEVKQREERKGLPVLASSIEAIKEIAKIDIQSEVLGTAYWPGPLTLILPKLEKLPPIVTGGKENVAVRIPQNPIALKLAELSNGLIIGTSANISNQKSPVNVEEAIEQVGEEVDLIIDGGPAKFGVSSTIIDMVTKPPKVVRRGPIRILF